jgi:hypothetical protein
MSNEDSGFWTFRLLIAFGIGFAALFVYSLFDLVFLALGQDGTATITDAYVSRGRRSQSVIIEYKFTSDGHERTGKANLGDIDGLPEAGREFEIQYLPRWMLDAPDASRPKRSFNWIVLSLLLITCAGCGFFAYRAIYPPDDAPRGGPSRRR